MTWLAQEVGTQNVHDVVEGTLRTSCGRSTAGMAIYEKSFGLRANCTECQPKESDMVTKKKKTKSKSKDASATTNGKAHANPGKLPDGIPRVAVPRERYEERLPCKSNESLVAAKARELAKLEHQRTAWREWWKAQCAKARERRALFEGRIEELAAEVDGQVEYKNVEVVEYLLPTNKVIAVRQDTSEVVNTRTAEAEDLQEHIPGTEKRTGERTNPTEPFTSTKATDASEIRFEE